MTQPARVGDIDRLPTVAELRTTASYLVAAQEPTGAIPWEPGRHTDVWDHVECAMALAVVGEREAADTAYRWLRASQRHDGTWPIRQTAGVVQDAGADTNQCAYVAVGIWHHWLVHRDRRFVEEMWPTVRRALDAVAALQLPSGAVAWARGAGGVVCPEALLTGSSSIWQSLGCGMALANLLGEDPKPWPAVRARLGDAIARDDGAFEVKQRWSMDWYYPVLAGPVRGQQAWRRLRTRWDEFVVPGLGVRCVSDRPWVTGAETCELALALDALGDADTATRLVLDMQHLRDPDGSYHTGFVYADGLRWPIERSTWTAAAVILAVDAVRGSSGGAGIFRESVGG